MGSVFEASAPFQTVRYGTFTIHVTRPDESHRQHIALCKGSVSGQDSILCRVSSSCITSTALDCADCECAGQNSEALRQIGLAPQGLFIYLDQEGRGHGLSTKVRAMNWKAAGRDTFEAVESLGLAADNRSYEMLPDMLRELDIVSIDLMTNNPDKAVAIAATGVVVRRVVACIAPNPPVQSLRHLDAKRRRGHKL